MQNVQQIQSNTPIELLPLLLGTNHLCPIRNKSIRITPEELVRQSYIAKMLAEQVSAANIDLEVAVGRWSKKTFPRCAASFADPAAQSEWKGRADLVLWHMDPNTVEHVPLVVIEFKRGDLALADNGIDQLLDYADALNAPWAQLTNGRDALTFRWDEDSQRYHPMADLPPPSLLFRGDSGTPLQEIPLVTSASWRDLCDPQFHSRVDLHNEVVGCHTPFHKRPYIFDLVLALRDEQQHVQLDCATLGPDFVSAVDCGIRIENQGTPGGTWQSITYRVFKLDRCQAQPLFVGFGVTTWGQSSSRLMVRVWDASGALEPHHSLQANLDTGLRPRGDSCSLRHSGALTVGRGSVARDRVFEAVSRVRPEFINGTEIDLGAYPHDGNRTTLQTLAPVLQNIICYCMVRDALRDEVQAERK